ncbi:hypothetical protein [Bradyrhizobium liaoningense]|uniref:hypothetical protein n=1 Tax=Bradyrhizobium liaoningense TaxID=43992 RepID=UPI001BADF40A|nr:hypothetical protein [Bradyrhizobium liaoningense]MBR0712709.1 hypothetical protein [Bradyrhizobium liaoningense]
MVDDRKRRGPRYAVTLPTKTAAAVERRAAKHGRAAAAEIAAIVIEKMGTGDAPPTMGRPRKEADDE